MLKSADDNNEPLTTETIPSAPDLSDLFYHINRVVPADQVLVTIPPHLKVRDAFVILKNQGYSQVPVVLGQHVLGVFSVSSFARKAAEITLEEVSRDKCAPGDWVVEECLDPCNFFRVTDNIDKSFESLDRDGFVLIGAQKLLQGVMTQTDVLGYFYSVANPFVIISEIELTLRELIRRSISQQQLEIFSARSLKSLHDANNIPKRLEEMTFDNYVSIICNGDNWVHFEPVFGGTRTRTGTKLRQIGKLRNDLFHFKRDLTAEDNVALSELRKWILIQAQKNDARRVAGAKYD